MRSTPSTDFGPLLGELGLSLLLTTYQAGKLVVLRPKEGGLGIHFRTFPRPMGLAVHGDRLALGTAWEIWEYHNHPAVAGQLEPAGSHDVCFLPRLAHVTGDVQIHEMAWVTRDETGTTEPELWFVNTRFSCLCTRGMPCSFVPRWRPRFVSACVPEDRCHLNGLGLRDGQVRYVTALGETDTPGGWRANKRSGGVLIDLAADEILARGLSMPHSPRWYAGRLWVLHSGTGGLGTVDPTTGKYEEVTSLPGFTRGLDFWGRLAFVGLSRVRDGVASGTPIAERPAAEQQCGVWVVDVVRGQTVAFVRFDDAVREIFAVQVLPARCPDVLNDDAARLADSFVLPDNSPPEAAPFLRQMHKAGPGAHASDLAC